MKKILPIISIVFICFSCGSNDLTLSQAEELLLRNCPRNVEATLRFGKDVVIPGGYQSDHKETKLAIKNMVKMKFTPNYQGRLNRYVITPTDKMQKLIISQKPYKRGLGTNYLMTVACGELKLNQVKNVFREPNSNAATVEYELQFEENELHELVKPYARGGYEAQKYPDGRKFIIKQDFVLNTEGTWVVDPLEKIPSL